MSCGFTSYRAYYDFAYKVKNKSRYIRDSDTNEFLSSVITTANKREKSMPAGTILWRSQLGHDWVPQHQEGEYVGDLRCPFSFERMKPLKKSSSEGRANPKGISYLYLATDKETSMSEVRPWVGASISVVQFKTSCDLKLINCVINRSGNTIYFEEPEPSKREESVWEDINRAFSEPVNPDDSIANYVPTQIIAELFKNAGYDGIIYKTNFGKGLNIVLFDMETAEIINPCYLFKVRSVTFTFRQEANPCFLTTTKTQKNKNPGTATLKAKAQ
jgi:hypothetical protein